jgi:hypothetical protein
MVLGRMLRGHDVAVGLKCGACMWHVPLCHGVCLPNDVSLNHREGHPKLFVPLLPDQAAAGWGPSPSPHHSLPSLTHGSLYP